MRIMVLCLCLLIPASAGAKAQADPAAEKAMNAIIPTWGHLITNYISEPDSVICDTTSIQFGAGLKDGDGIKRIIVRSITSHYEWKDLRGYSLAPTSDTLVVMDLQLPFMPDSTFIEFEIPGRPPGSLVRYVLMCYDSNDTLLQSAERQYRIYPVRGKATPSLSPVNVSDMLRLVYVFMGWVPPRPADYFGLDLNDSGTFSNEDLDLLLELWRKQMTSG